MEAVPELPLLWDTHQAPSAFDPEDWLLHCEAASGRARPALPTGALQVLDGRLWSAAVERAAAPPDDFTQAEHPWVLVVAADGSPVAVARSAKGSYAAGGLDELAALGVRACVVVGGAGSLVAGVLPGDLVVPGRALCDDGVSWHYAGPRRWIDADAALAATVARRASALGAVHDGAVWTTTAHFRQARPRLEAFRSAGCIVVDNESAGAFAVGAARGLAVARLLVVGDVIGSGRFVAPATPSGPGPSALLDVALAALRDHAQEVR